MDKNGIVTKSVYSSTIEGITTRIQIHYNTFTDHIGTYIGFQKALKFNNGSVINKKCSLYLGVTVAEQVLSKVFKNVERMPNCNRGYDFICGKRYKIDVKSSTKRKNSNGWFFHINRNQIANYFLCLALDNRQQLNPLHVWLIPSKRIAHLSTLAIVPSAINKWSEFELTDKMDKVITCCNIMKGDN